MRYALPVAIVAQLVLLSASDATAQQASMIPSTEMSLADTVYAESSVQLASATNALRCKSGDCGTGCCNSCGPKWYARVDALWLERDDPRETGIAQNLNTDELLTNVNDGFEQELGARVVVAQELGCGRELEFVYFGLHDHQTEALSPFDSRSWDGVPEFNQVPGNGGGFAQADQYGWRYESEIHNVEINCRKRCGYGLTWLLGFRYINLKESFGVAAFEAVEGDAFHQSLTENSLYGFQAGADWTYQCSCRFSVDAMARGGLYANDYQVANGLINSDGSMRGSNLGGKQVAGVFEAGAHVRWNLKRGWSVRGGYNFLWIEGVTLAAEQFNYDVATEEGSVFYHGPSIGVECWR